MQVQLDPQGIQDLRDLWEQQVLQARLDQQERLAQLERQVRQVRLEQAERLDLKAPQGQLAALVQQVLSDQRVLRDLLVRQATPVRWVQLDLRVPPGQQGLLGLSGRQVLLVLRVSRVIPVRLARRVQLVLQDRLERQVQQAVQDLRGRLVMSDLQARLGLLVFRVRLDPLGLRDYRETLVPQGRLVLRVRLVPKVRLRR